MGCGMAAACNTICCTQYCLRRMEWRVQINIKTANGSTALHNAATNGHDDIVRLLLDRDCAINARALSGATALYGAASGGNLLVVRWALPHCGPPAACTRTQAHTHTNMRTQVIMVCCPMEKNDQLPMCSSMHAL